MGQSQGRCDSGSKVEVLPFLEGSQGMQMPLELEGGGTDPLANTLTLAHETHFQTSDLQNYRRMNWWCLGHYICDNLL